MKKLTDKFNENRWNRIQNKIDSGKRKSSFLRNIIIKKSYKPPIREIIIKSIVLFALTIGFLGTNWRLRTKNKAIVNEAYKKIIDPSFIYLAPAFAFSMVMAFMPILLLIYLVIGSNSVIEHQVNAMLNSIFGQFYLIFQDTSSTWATFLKSPSSAFSILIIIFTSTWVSAAGFSKFIYSCSLIYKHDRFGGFLMNRFRGISIVVSISLYFAFIFTLFTGISIGINSLTWLRNIHWLFIAVSKIVLFLYILGSIYVGICLLFKYAPRFKLTWKQVHAGAVIAAIPTTIFLTLFTIISSYFINYSSIGGNLSYFMTLSMSLLIFAYFIYVGVIANAAFYNIQVAKSTKRKLTLSRK